MKKSAKQELRQKRNELDPLDLAEEVERRLSEIFRLVERIDEVRWEEIERAGEFSVGLDSVAATVAPAPCAFTPSNPTEKLVKTSPDNHKTTKRLVS